MVDIGETVHFRSCLCHFCGSKSAITQRELRRGSDDAQERILSLVPLSMILVLNRNGLQMSVRRSLRNINF